MAVHSVTNAESSAGYALRGFLDYAQKAETKRRRQRRSPGEARMAGLWAAGGQYTYPGGWSTDKLEQVRHFRGWFYVAARTICESYACMVPQVGYRRAPEDAGPKNKRLLDRHQRRKALTHLQQHEEIELVDSDHPLLRLLNNPNGPDVGYTGRFREMMFTLLTGESYLWKVRNSVPGAPGKRQVAELWPLFSQWVTPKPGTTKLVETYIIRPTGYGNAGTVGGWEIPAEDVIPILEPSPLSLVHGWSPLRACAEWLDTAEAIDTAKWFEFENGVFPSFFIELDPQSFGREGPTQPQLDRFNQKFIERTQGREKHKRPVILTPGMKIAGESRTPVEMDFVNSGDSARDNALASVRVPKTKAGIVQDVNRAAMQASLDDFNQNTMGPRLTHRGQVYTEHLAQDFDEELVVFWPNTTPPDPEQQNADIEQDLKAFAITPNEVRKLRGREPYELGGDNPVGPGGLPLPWNVEEQSGVDMYGEAEADRGGPPVDEADDWGDGRDGEFDGGGEADDSWLDLSGGEAPKKKAFDPGKHPRGQPENAGQFGPGGGGSRGSEGRGLGPGGGSGQGEGGGRAAAPPLTAKAGDRIGRALANELQARAGDGGKVPADSLRPLLLKAGNRLRGMVRAWHAQTMTALRAEFDTWLDTDKGREEVAGLEANRESVLTDAAAYVNGAGLAFGRDPKADPVHASPEGRAATVKELREAGGRLHEFLESYKRDYFDREADAAHEAALEALDDAEQYDTPEEAEEDGKPEEWAEQLQGTGWRVTHTGRFWDIEPDVGGSSKSFDPGKHPRGQPENAGQFGPGGGGAGRGAERVGTLGDGTAVRFVPHPNRSRGETTVMVDAAKLDAGWSRDAGYYIPPGGGGGGEVGGRRAAFARFLTTGRAVEAPRVTVDRDGTVSFTDGRHRFAALRDLGIDRVAVTVPRSQAGRLAARRQGNGKVLANGHAGGRLGGLMQ